MTSPVLLGRLPGETNEEASSRSSTEFDQAIEVSYEGAAIGTVKVEVFRSTDDEDRGGVVLRLTVENGSSSFVPAARTVQDGVEIHMAGDAEGASLIRALRGVLAALPA